MVGLKIGNIANNIYGNKNIVQVIETSKPTDQFKFQALLLFLSSLMWKTPHHEQPEQFSKLEVSQMNCCITKYKLGHWFA